MLRTSFFLTLAALAFSPMAPAQQFVRDAAAIPAQTVWTDGVELVDVDADGDIDILFANGSSYGGTGTQGSQPQHLYKNNGSGVFSEAHAQLNVSNFNAKMVIAEDFDNDGDPDLFYASGSQGFTPRILINNGSGVFANESGTRLPSFSPNPRSFGVAAGDIDDDGDMDVALSDGGTFGGIASQVKLLLNDGTGNFTDVTGAQLPADLYNCQDVTMLDFDGDFDIDICMSGKGGTGKRGRLYLNDGTGNFSINGAMNGLGSSATYEVDWGDFDGDNDFDAAVQSIAGQNEGWGENIGTAALMLESTFPNPNGNDDNEMACVDYDNDGDLDVFVACLSSAGEKVYRNNGGGSWTNHNAAVQTITDSTLDFGFADLDGDDTYDMVTGQGESGNWTNKIYFNGGPADTLAPTVMGTDVPTTLGDPTTVLHVQLSDGVSDDGHISAVLDFDWTTVGVVDSDTDVAATHMGGGLFRVAVPTPAGTTSATVDATATDSVGNSVALGPYTIPPAGGAWTDIGFGLAGVSGVPVLTGTGTMVVGTPNSVDLTNAAPSALAVQFASLASTPAPFKGGTLATIPVLLSTTLGTSGGGTIPIAIASWPGGLPPGTSIYVQYAIVDAVGPVGVSLSNAIKGLQP